MDKGKEKSGKDIEQLDFSLVLASSVHDMKNSLGMLLNSLEAVIQDTPAQNAKQAERFATLQYEASRINTELIQLLSIYRMQNNRMPLNIDENYVIDVLDEQIARNHMLFQTRGIQVNVDCDDDLNWYFDSELVGGVIHNILVNCARYTREQLQISAKLEDNILVIEIADDGQGYPQAMLDAPLGNDSGSSSHEDSTHLGLFFAAEVAAMHCQKDTCGRILLENGGPLGGGVFKMYLP